MVRLLAALSIAVMISVAAFSAPLQAAAPRLVVVVSVDQLVYKYLQRYDQGFADKGFFRTAQRKGATFENCYHRHAFTLTGPGHSVLLTGCYPQKNGIVSNGWFDAALGRTRYCVEDPNVGIVGLPEGKGGNGVSPASLQAETLGDVLKRSTGSRAKVFGVSLKDRSSILMAGRKADAVYWFKDQHWVTSSYYRKDLPPYLRSWNESRVGKKYAGTQWKLLLPRENYLLLRADDYQHENNAYGLGRAFPHRLAAADNPKFVAQLPCTPFGNDLTLQAAQMLIDFEQLGQDKATDLLVIGFSSNDLIGHRYGPHSLEVQDVTFRTDRLLGDFLRYLDEHIGTGNWVLGLTSDHGVAPLPEFLAEIGRKPTQRNPLGDHSLRKLRTLIEGRLRQTLGPPPGNAKYVLKAEVNQITLNRNPEVLAGKRLQQARKVTKAALLENKTVHSAFTREELLDDSQHEDKLLPRVRKSFHPARSGDVLYVLAPYHIQTTLATTHGSPWPYDSHVPLMLIGSGIQPGQYKTQVSPAQLGPTLAKLLQLEPPMHSDETPLNEALRSD